MPASGSSSPGRIGLSHSELKRPIPFTGLIGLSHSVDTAERSERYPAYQISIAGEPESREDTELKRF